MWATLMRDALVRCMTVSQTIQAERVLVELAHRALAAAGVAISLPLMRARSATLATTPALVGMPSCVFLPTVYTEWFTASPPPDIQFSYSLKYFSVTL